MGNLEEIQISIFIYLYKSVVYLCLYGIVLDGSLVRVAIHNVRRIGVTGVVVVLEYLFIGILGVWILTYQLFLRFVKIVQDSTKSKAHCEGEYTKVVKHSNKSK